MIAPSAILRRHTVPPVPPRKRSAAPGVRPDALIIGDGIGGLACAHYLLKAGVTPLVLCAPEPGYEQLRFFDHDGMRIDAFHSPIRPSDTALQGLLTDLNYADRVHWRSVEHQVQPASHSGVLERVRARVASSFLHGTELAERSLRLGRSGSTIASIAGSAAFRELLMPPVRAILGEVDEHVAPDSLRWALQEAHAPKRLRRGSLRGGWFDWTLQLRRRIADCGGVFLTPDGDTRLRLSKDGISLTGKHACDLPVGITTLPWEDLAALCGLDEPHAEGRESRERQDVVSVCIVARSGDLGSYSRTLQDRSALFPVCVQADRLLTRQETAGKRIFYLTRRFPHGERPSDDVLASKATESLEQAMPGFARSEIEATHVHVAIAAERIPAVGDPRGEFTRRVHDECSLFESSCVLRYPRPSGFETSVLMAREAAGVVLRELGV